MCYSAQLVQSHRDFLRAFPDAFIDLKEFAKLMERRWAGQPVTVPQAMDHSFLTSDRPEDAELASAVERYKERQEQELLGDLAAQKESVTKAEKMLALDETKKWRTALESAQKKIRRIESLLQDLRRVDVLPKDSRIYPKGYAPVLAMEDGELVIRPMRYLLRPQGHPPDFDTEFKGCYNARRDNLTRFWKKQFRHTHGVVMVQAFYENVHLHDFERRALSEGEKPKNAVVEFRPSDETTMFVACLWSHWTGEGDDLYSFAIITDEPPPEVRAVGHDRCPIQIRQERIRDWLDCKGKSVEELMALLDDRPDVTYRAARDR